MKVLVIGSGGREHALSWAIAQSDLCDELYCAPGNAGIHGCCAEDPNIDADDYDAVIRFCKDTAIDLVVVGPEVPLVDGIADKLRAENIAVFGPSAAASQLEGSKGFMKDLCRKYDIPTAAYERFTELAPAKAFIEKLGVPIVLKTDGLAAGKGVIIAETLEQAFETAEDMLSGSAFGDAGSEIIIEEFMDGEELSYFALADGKTILPLTSAQDHKRAFDGDEGPNTGGMGAYSPAHLMTPELEEKILSKIINPTVDAMAAEGCPFTGVFFAGLMVVNGEPKLIEYNIRFGDPECQPIMMRLKSDFLEILNAAAKGELETIKAPVVWSSKTTLCVVMAANGYPGSYAKNTVINGVADAVLADGVVVFHAGTAKNEAGEFVNIGGRVLGITAIGDDVADAQKLAYDAVSKIDWPDGFCRSDIGWRAVKAAKDQAA